MATESALPVPEVGNELAAIAAQLDQDIDGNKLDLPMLPSVAAEVLSSSLDDSSDAARLADLIQQDQSLASHVLRVVNSPAYRGAQEIVALQQAIARLGLNRIREVALSASLGSSLFKCPDYQSLIDRSWQISLGAGLWAKEFARSARKNVEIGYLCGLLHNIGNPLILQRLGQLKASVSEADAAGLLERFSSRAGAVLAREWKLPALVAYAIEHLRALDDCDTNRDAVAVAASGVLAAELMIDSALEPDALVGAQSVQFLNLYPDDVEQILGEAEQVQLALESMT